VTIRNGASAAKGGGQPTSGKGLQMGGAFSRKAERGSARRNGGGEVTKNVILRTGEGPAARKCLQITRKTPASERAWETSRGGRRQ